MKTCTSCKQTKPPSFFYKNPRTKDALGSQCKMCDRAGRAARRLDKKLQLVAHFGGKCIWCGYSKCPGALDFHHQGTPKTFTISENMDRSLAELVSEATKCVLICANCHREAHWSTEVALTYNGKRRKRRK